MYYADRSFDFEAAEFYLIPLLCQSFIFRMAQYIITKQPVGPHTLGNIIQIRKKKSTAKYIYYSCNCHNDVDFVFNTTYHPPGTLPLLL